uniref:Transmembrane protein n=1 Tax=Pyrodinium bahamense TaxID=73915 RepID=A0A7S0FIT7_9DINO|mmetsp:Transcript_34003/g.94128  ORF Transcript_34003/g.94128 Transcript_34003/m.94128 type:complete len:206 (+) Transcript_34003:142-759(+)
MNVVPPTNEAPGSGDVTAASFGRQMKPWFVTFLILQTLLLVLRWRMGDAHGALLMLAVVAVGCLALTVGVRGGIDEVYGGYFGLMALVSGLLDLNLAIESLVWGDWRHLHHAQAKIKLASFAKPLLYLVCALVQLLAAFIAYLLYKDAELDGDYDVTEPVFATPDDARIYNAVLSHSERQTSMQARGPGGIPPLKPFAGAAHKLP